MTDLDLLTGVIAARVRLLPDVARLYPTRTGLDALARSVGELLDAVADDPTVAIRPVEHGYLVEASVGLTGETAAPVAAALVRSAIRDACAQSDVAVHGVRVRVSSID